MYSPLKLECRGRFGVSRRLLEVLWLAERANPMSRNANRGATDLRRDSSQRFPLVEWQTQAGLKAFLIAADDALRLEPQITLPLTGAAMLPEEAQVTPRALVAALRGACAAQGCALYVLLN